jgi:hypothetical protein
MRDKELIQIGRIWGKLEAASDLWERMPLFTGKDELIQKLNEDEDLGNNIAYALQLINGCIRIFESIKDREEFDE